MSDHRHGACWLRHYNAIRIQTREALDIVLWEQKYPMHPMNSNTRPPSALRINCSYRLPPVYDLDGSEWHKHRPNRIHANVCALLSILERIQTLPLTLVSARTKPTSANELTLLARD